MPALAVKAAAFKHLTVVGKDRLPDLLHAGIDQGTARQYRRLPPGIGRTHEVKRIFVDPPGLLRLFEIFPVGLVDGQGIGNFQDAPLDSLKLVSAAGKKQHQEKIDHRGNGILGLANAHGFHDDHVEAGRFAHDNRLARLAGDAAKGPPRRRRADVGAGIRGELFHPCLISQDAASAFGAGGIHGKDGHAVPLFQQAEPQAFDKGGFPHPGNTGYPQPDGMSGMGKQAVQYSRGKPLVP